MFVEKDYRTVTVLLPKHCPMAWLCFVMFIIHCNNSAIQCFILECITRVRFCHLIVSVILFIRDSTLTEIQLPGNGFPNCHIKTIHAT